MKLYCGPCLLTPDQEAIDDIYKTADRLAAIDKDIRFRCKLWGGGTTPEKYIEGIGIKGINHLYKIQDKLKVGLEVRDSDSLAEHYEIDGAKGFFRFNQFDFVWVAARSAQNYTLLKNISYDAECIPEVLIKRGYGMTIDEVIGVHDICEKIHGYKPIMVERGINTFLRNERQRWMPDFSGMLRIIKHRPDIQLCFDVSHACGIVDDIFPMVRAAVALGVKNFMFEVMNDPSLSQTDKGQIMNIDEFRKCYNYIKNNT